MSRINKSQFAILGWLSKSHMSGYDLKQKLSKVSPFHWSESNAQIYPILKKLEEEGLVSSKLDTDSGARNRRIYLITSEGLKHLEEWLHEPVEMTQYREELLLKLSLGERLDLDETLSHIQEHQSQLLFQIRTLQQIKRHIDDEHKNKEDHRYLLFAHRYSEVVLEAKLKWCDEVLKALRESAAAQSLSSKVS